VRTRGSEQIDIEDAMTIAIGESVALERSAESLATVPLLRYGAPADRSSPRVVEVNPYRCRVWALHDRISDYISEESCRAEIDSVARDGQLIPALGRCLPGDPDYDVEIICGVRRLFVAQHLNRPLKVELRHMSEREAIIAMDQENRHRKDISPYERGLGYARLLRSGHFSSQDDIVRALKISASQVSRLLKLAQLPSVLLNAFASPLEIREGWGLDLLKAWHDPKKKPLLAQRARALAEQTPRPGPNAVYSYLTATSGEARRARRSSRGIVVMGGHGAPLFRIKYQLNAVSLILPSAAVSESCIERIRLAVSEILQQERAG